jgi:hypothetical protein
MIEMVGDFDAGQDPFNDEQRTAAIETVAHLVRAFGLQDADLGSLYGSTSGPRHLFHYLRLQDTSYSWPIAIVSTTVERPLGRLRMSGGTYLSNVHFFRRRSPIAHRYDEVRTKS